MEENDLTAREDHEDDLARARRKFILHNGVLLWGVLTAILSSYLKSKSLQEFFHYFIIDIIVFPIGGYFWGSAMWSLQGKQIYEARLAAKNAPAKRVPVSVGLHPGGLVAGFLVGVLIVFIDVRFRHATLADYAAPGLATGSLMLIQLLLDLKYEEEEYVIRTTSPSPGFTFQQSLRMKWPAYLILILTLPLGPLKVSGIFSICLIFSYPYQRRFYLRSQREFKEH